MKVSPDIIELLRGIKRMTGLPYNDILNVVLQPELDRLNAMQKARPVKIK